jgi:hypothetical protein
LIQRLYNDLKILNTENEQLKTENLKMAELIADGFTPTTVTIPV